jgi:hypothetical protein
MLAPALGASDGGACLSAQHELASRGRHFGPCLGTTSEDRLAGGCELPACSQELQLRSEKIGLEVGQLVRDG